MDITDIRETCKQIIDETNAITAYTDSIEAVSDEKLKSIYAEIRNDELGHLQKHVVALTEILSGEEPVKAAQMDENDGPVSEATGNKEGATE